MLGNPYWTPQLHQNLPKPARDNVLNIMLSFQRNNDSSQTILPYMPNEMVLAMLRDLRLSDLLPSPSEEQQVNLPLPDSSEERATWGGYPRSVFLAVTIATGYIGHLIIGKLSFL